MGDYSSNMCMNDMLGDARRCLVKGKNGEMFANYDCVVERMDGGRMEKSCRSLVAHSKHNANEHDFYTIDRQSDAPQLQNCQSSYESCCARNGHPNLFQKKNDYAHGKRPVCHIQQNVTGPYMVSRDIHGAAESHERGRTDQLSFFRFDGGQNKYTWDGKEQSVSRDAGCFYDDHHAPIGNQCDVSHKSKKCNQKLNMCALDHVFVPLKSGTLPKRTEIVVPVQRRDLKRTFPKENNALRQNYLQYVAALASESKNMYDMFHHGFQSVDDSISVSDSQKDGQKDVLYTSYLQEYLQADTATRAGLKGLIKQKDLEAMSSLQDKDDKILAQYLSGNPDQRRELFKNNKGLQSTFQQFQDTITLQEYIPNKDKALRMAKNGEFNMVYTTSKRDCQAEKERAEQNKDLDDESKKQVEPSCTISKSAASNYLKQLDGFDPKIRAAIQDSVQKQNSPYDGQSPRSMRGRKFTSAYDQNLKPSETETVAYFADQILPL